MWYRNGRSPIKQHLEDLKVVPGELRLFIFVDKVTDEVTTGHWPGRSRSSRWRRRLFILWSTTGHWRVTREVKMIKMTCGRRGWGEWCLPWSWQWSRPCSPRSKAATMFVFIHIWILRAYLSFNMRVLLMLQQVLCPVHILLPVRDILAKNSLKKSFCLIATSSASLGRIPFWTSMSAHIGGETITYRKGLEETINLWKVAYHFFATDR